MRPINILIVDDQESNIITMQSMLEEHLDNIVIHTENSGSTCLEATLRQKFDIILLDILMPDMDGFEVIKFLKSNERTKDIAVIFMTAIFESSNFENKGLQMGAIAYLTKPFDITMTIAIIEREIENIYKREA
jgi:CheY-like chemotaxis protein